MTSTRLRQHVRYVTKRNCYTVPETHYKQVPYTVCRMVTEQHVRYVTKRNCYKVPEEHVCQVPYTTCRTVSETCYKTVPYTVCRSPGRTNISDTTLAVSTFSVPAVPAQPCDDAFR